ncbi:unnamed protein product [Prunus armeniaca]
MARSLATWSIEDSSMWTSQTIPGWIVSPAHVLREWFGNSMKGLNGMRNKFSLTNGWVEIKIDNDYFGVVKLVKGNQLFVLYITKNSTPRPLNVQSLVFSAYGENAEDYEETAHGYDVDEENGQYDFLFVDKEEDFGEAEEEYVKLR